MVRRWKLGSDIIHHFGARQSCVGLKRMANNDMPSVQGPRMAVNNCRLLIGIPDRLLFINYLGEWFWAFMRILCNSHFPPAICFPLLGRFVFCLFRGAV